MPRRFSLFSLPLLAALLLGLPAWRAPAVLGPVSWSKGRRHLISAMLMVAVVGLIMSGGNRRSDNS
jgi:hypothetical protein